jgi:hypothetical protein
MTPQFEEVRLPDFMTYKVSVKANNKGIFIRIVWMDG